jgi:peptidoglycan/xylan/chitin deacetylase (PgdA/CDA1 family)
MPARVRSLIVATVLLISACAAPSPSRTPTAVSTATPTPTAAASPGATASPTSTPVPACGAGCITPATFRRHGSRAGKVIALTFDDGFNIPACISIVRTLLGRQVPATFFPNGQYVRENPSFWHWVSANGFPVGNHTTTHNDARTLGPAALGLSLDSDRRIVDGALGAASIDVFRPPYGTYDLQVQEVAAVAGYPVLVGWDVDSMDQTGAPSVAAEVANASTGTNGSIVLMHCGSPLTPLALPAIIDGYRARGFSFVTIPQLLDLPVPMTGWLPPAVPDPGPVREVAPIDLQPSWNASPAIDTAGHLHVAYETPAGITFGDDSAGSWQSVAIASTTGSAFVSRPSIALDGSGGVHLVFLSSTAAGTELLYEHRAADGTWSLPEMVARLGAPASTATIAIDPSGLPVIAYAELHGAQAGIMLARPAVAGWASVRVATTNGTFLSPSIAIDGAGAIYLIARRNGYSDIDLTTNVSDGWVTRRLFAASGSAVAFAAFDPAGRLVVAAQESFGAALTLGIGPAAGPLTWTTVTSVGDLSGLAIAPGGSPQVAFSRVPRSGGPSRIWLAAVVP